MVDPETGEKQTSLTTSSSESICPNTPLLYIGRTGMLTSNADALVYLRAYWIFILHPFETEYMVTMFDTKTQELRWNATYNDYSAPPYDEKQDYSMSQTHMNQEKNETARDSMPHFYSICFIFDFKMSLWKNCEMNPL